jgi:transcriptional regulator with XRE-family HTH domain
MKQMFHKKSYIDFFNEHILCIDMVNEAIKNLIADKGGNKKVIASRLAISPQFLGQLERGERKKPSAELVAKIKEVYGVDILTGETVASSNETKKASDLERLVSTFEKAVDSFRYAMESKEKQVDRLEADKDWMKSHIDRLTLGFDSLQKAQ